MIGSKQNISIQQRRKFRGSFLNWKINALVSAAGKFYKEFHYQEIKKNKQSIENHMEVKQEVSEYLYCMK